MRDLVTFQPGLNCCVQTMPSYSGFQLTPGYALTILSAATEGLNQYALDWMESVEARLVIKVCNRLCKQSATATCSLQPWLSGSAWLVCLVCCLPWSHSCTPSGGRGLEES
jgi:hypothetical protein